MSADDVREEGKILRGQWGFLNSCGDGKATMWEEECVYGGRGRKYAG